MRLGDLDALKDAINFGISDAPTYIKATVDQYIDEAPTIDAVPVVRCRDCKYYRNINCLEHGCSSVYGITEPDDDDFCSYGELKEDKNEISEP